MEGRFLRLGILAVAACASGTPDADTTETDSDPVAPTCPDGSAIRAWNDEGPFGTRRHDLADDARLTLVGGDRIRLSELWSGCDAVAFVPDTVETDRGSGTSVWETDLGALLEASPAQVHWVFLPGRSGQVARDAAKAMAERVDTALAKLKPKVRAAWQGRVHVVREGTDDQPDWLAEVVRGVGAGGFVVDRAQVIRPIGSLGDVKRPAGADGWPDSTLVYAAHEVRYLERLVADQEAWAARGGLVLPLLQGEIVEQFADVEVELPSAEELLAYDTLEVAIDMRCPDPDAIEFGNCGAWDYLAHLWLDDGTGAFVELARFITSYHRETWWTFDLTPMLPLLTEGGKRKLRWEWAPEWNKQPTATRIELRLSHQGRGERPVAITRLFQGGAFDSAYNDGREPVTAAVPAGASRVELWTLVTGHGGATNNCAEFCDHQHELTVNGGPAHLKTHPTVGQSEGCVGELVNGMVPNQWGTWWYGRGGWCPGQAVAPWVVDVTGEVTPGQDATVSYRGLYAGGTPPDNAGNILLHTWWVVYEPDEAGARARSNR